MKVEGWRRTGHRGMVSTFFFGIILIFSPFLFILTSRDSCQFPRLLRILQGKSGWLSAFSTVSLGFHFFWSAKSSICLLASDVVLLLLPLLFSLSSWIYALKKSLYCAFSGVSGGSKIRCLYLSHSFALQLTPALFSSPISSSDIP